MVCFSRAVFGVFLLSNIVFTNSIYAKPIKNKYGATEQGKMPKKKLEELSREVVSAQSGMSQSHYEDVVADPQKARNDRERLAGLSAREVFILVDRSGSMTADDDDPTGSSQRSWSRWNSAQVAAESIAELALSLDADGQVDVMLWDGDSSGRVQSKYEVMTKVNQISQFFKENPPRRGNTPLAGALEEVYNKNLRSLLSKSEPFTVIVLTDGAPNDPMRVKSFFQKIIRENNLEQKGRETLAAFSFVRMGDDSGAIRFLEDLDDNLISQMSVNVDIVDTKEDNFLFGTGKYKRQDGVGPFALFWDALYD
jgi:hypothetical protein